VPSQEQALQQVILLKKELAEIRAKQAMDEDQHAKAQMSMSKEVSLSFEKGLYKCTKMLFNKKPTLIFERCFSISG